jgi:maltose alpha-D-glucosyltransferase / alpha-amylase
MPDNQMERLESILKPLYKDDTARVVKEITQEARKYKKVETRPEDKIWYKFMCLYAVYPDSIKTGTGKPLVRLAKYLPKIRDFGCNAVHILPFLKSPMVDRGFDISDFCEIRSDLGSKNDLKNLVKVARENYLHLFMDLVFNHVSNEHSWYKKAVSGDQHYRNYFLHTKEKPIYKRTIEKKGAYWAEYIVKGKKRLINIAFPELVGKIPHFEQGPDEYWYYHTYYPQQPDLDWSNPEVFIEMSKILLYWADFGFNFRLDAIPFVGKPIYKDVEDVCETTHILIAAFKAVVQEVNTQTAFIVESFEDIDTVIRYFGSTNQPEANLSYNFHLNTNIWAMLATYDTKYYWKTISQTEKIPKHAEWVNFVRNHDELNLGYIPKNVLKGVKRQIEKKGMPFRQEFGVSGRSFSLLGESKERFLMAYFLMCSMPCAILIPYGDEYGKENVPFDKLSKEEKDDTRNINRGFIDHSLTKDKKSLDIYRQLKHIIKIRSKLQGYMNINPQKIDLQKSIFSAKYTVGSSELYVLINLTAKIKKLNIPEDNLITIGSVNNTKLTRGKVQLGPYAGIWLQK